MTKVPIGKDCVLAYATSWATPAWTEVLNAVDVSQPGISKTQIDLPARASGGWRPKGAGLKDMDLQFGYLYEDGDSDTILAALRDSFLNDTPLIFGVFDNEIGASGVTYAGFRFPGQVFEFPINQELEDGMRIDITVGYTRMKEGSALLLPEWFSATPV